MNKEDWLNKKFDVYLDPLYYEEILPLYKFHGKTDEEILEEYLIETARRQGYRFKCALELGCGSGRGTKIIERYCDKVIAIDLSKEMIKLAKEKIKYKDKVKFYHAEMLEFVKNNPKLIKNVDLVVSLWALNYSLNAEFAYRDPAKQIFKPMNPDEALKKCHRKLDTLFNNISQNSKFIFFHYDPESEEQRIAHKCWQKILPFPWNEKSPSLFALRKYFERQNNIDSCICKLNGVVDLGNKERAMEIFMNFHLHTSFNRHPLRDEIMKIIDKNLKKYNPEKILMGASVIIIKGEKYYE